MKYLLDELDKIKKMMDSDEYVKHIEVTAPTTIFYYEFIDRIIQDHVEKFTVDKSLNFFEKKVGAGKNIDNIIESLVKMTTAVKKCRTDAVRGTDKEITKLLVSNKVDNSPRLVDRYHRAPSKPIKDTEDVKYYSESLDPSLAAPALILFMGGIHILGGGLMKTSEKYNPPKKIELNTINVDAVYNTVWVKMEPDKFLTKISRISKKAASTIGSNASIAGFEVKGISGTVKYANKINRLIKAYTNFYIALLDMYIRLMKDAISMSL